MKNRQASKFCICFNPGPSNWTYLTKQGPFPKKIHTHFEWSCDNIKMFTSVLQAGCEMPQWLHWRILHGHVVVTCACKLFLAIVSSQFAFVQETTLRGHDARWALKDRWSSMANAHPWLYYLRFTNHLTTVNSEQCSQEHCKLQLRFTNHLTTANSE